MYFNASYSNKICLIMFCELVYYLIMTQLSFTYHQNFKLLCNICYWNFLLTIFVVSLHNRALISCVAKCYFSKLRYQLLLVQCFWKKLKNINFRFFYHFWPLKCRTFLRMDHLFYIIKLFKNISLNLMVNFGKFNGKFNIE